MSMNRPPTTQLGAVVTRGKGRARAASRIGIRPASLQAFGGRSDLRLRGGLGGAARVAGALEVDHPARVFGGQGAGLVQELHMLAGELKVRGGQVVGELFGALGADDDAG